MPATPPLLADKPVAPPVERTKPQIQHHALGMPFTLHYDKLVIAVGAYSQSRTPRCPVNLVYLILLLAFNVPGVKEYAYFLKDVRDARSIRMRILECGSLK